MLDVGRALDDVDRLAAVGRADHLHLLVLEQRGQREDVARVVVDDQHLAAAQRLVGAVQALEHLLLRRRQVGDDAVQEQRRSRRAAAPATARPSRTMLLAIALSRASLVVGQLLAGEDDDRHVDQLRLGMRPSRAGRSRSCRAGAGRAPRNRTTWSRIAASASLPVPTATVSMSSIVRAARRSRRARCRRPRPRAAAWCARGVLLDPAERRLQAVGGGRLDEVGEGAARQAVLALLLER